MTSSRHLGVFDHLDRVKDTYECKISGEGNVCADLLGRFFPVRGKSGRRPRRIASSPGATEMPRIESFAS